MIYYQYLKSTLSPISPLYLYPILEIIYTELVVYYSRIFRDNN